MGNSSSNDANRLKTVPLKSPRKKFLRYRKSFSAGGKPPLPSDRDNFITTTATRRRRTENLDGQTTAIDDRSTVMSGRPSTSTSVRRELKKGNESAHLTPYSTSGSLQPVQPHQQQKQSNSNNVGNNNGGNSSSNNYRERDRDDSNWFGLVYENAGRAAVVAGSGGDDSGRETCKIEQSSRSRPSSEENLDVERRCRFSRGVHEHENEECTGGSSSNRDREYVSSALRLEYVVDENNSRETISVAIRNGLPNTKNEFDNDDVVVVEYGGDDLRLSTGDHGGNGTHTSQVSKSCEKYAINKLAERVAVDLGGNVDDEDNSNGNWEETDSSYAGCGSDPLFTASATSVTPYFSPDEELNVIFDVCEMETTKTKTISSGLSGKENSTPITMTAAADKELVTKTSGSFTVVKHKKVELSPTTFPTQRVSVDGKGRQLPLTETVTPTSPTSPLESNVLKKVASLTFDKAAMEQKSRKSKFIPEKVDLHGHEKFEGQMLINWFLSSCTSKSPAQSKPKSTEIHSLAFQFCSLLLSAGVIRQIEDKDTPNEETFKPNLMYCWTHTETSNTSTPSPSRFSSTIWPPYKNSASPVEVMKPSTEENTELCVEILRQRLQEKEKKISELENMMEVMQQRLQHSQNETDIQIIAKSKTESAAPEFVVRNNFKSTSVWLSNTDEKKTVTKIQENSVDDKNFYLSIHTSPKKLSEPFYEPKTSIESAKGSPNAVSPATAARSQHSKIPVPLHKSNSISHVPMSPETNDQIPPLESRAKSDNTVNDVCTPIDTKHLPKVALPATAKIMSVSSTRTLATQTSWPDLTVVASNSSHSPSKPSPSPTLSTTITITASSQAPAHPTIAPPPPPPPPMPLPPSVQQPLPPPPPPPSVVPESPSIPPPPPPPMSPTSLGQSFSSTPMPAPPPPPLPPTSGIPPPPAMPPPPPPSNAPPPPPPPQNSQNAGNGPAVNPVPLPTPPLGGWNAQRATFRKQPLTPKVPMKPLYWTRLVVPDKPVTVLSAVEKSKLVWEEIEEPSINDEEFMSLFSRQVVEKKAPKKRIEKSSKIQVTKLLDPKRSQNVGILASSLHLDFSEIENAVYNFDTSVVSLEVLQQIHEIRATNEEIKLIKDHLANHPNEPLDKPEQFLLELSEIPHFAERIACFVIQSEFNDAVFSVRNKLSNIKAICEKLMSSKELKKVIAIILALGNFMNGGNLQRGQADGFGLDILPKLKDVKSKDNSLTLLHYIVKTYLKMCDDPLSALLPIPEPSDVEQAASIQFDDITLQLSNLHKDLKDCECKVEKIVSDEKEENVKTFGDKMRAFLRNGYQLYEEELENLEESKKKFMSVLKFYHFQSKSSAVGEETNPKDFFFFWAPFCTDFKLLWRVEQQNLLKEKLKETRQKEKERRTQIKKYKKRESGLKASMKNLSNDLEDF